MPSHTFARLPRLIGPPYPPTFDLVPPTADGAVLLPPDLGLISPKPPRFMGPWNPPFATYFPLGLNPSFPPIGIGPPYELFPAGFCVVDVFGL